MMKIFSVTLNSICFLSIYVTNHNDLKLSKVISISVSISNLTTKDSMACLVWEI